MNARFITQPRTHPNHIRALQIKGPLLALLIAVTLLIAPGAPALAANDTVQLAATPAMFATETAAQSHCPKEEVVWLNIPSGIYHEKGQRWYGHTKHGAYVCKKEAEAAGERDTRNGQ